MRGFTSSDFETIKQLKLRQPGIGGKINTQINRIEQKFQKEIQTYGQ